MKAFLLITIGLVIALSSYSQNGSGNVNEYYNEKKEYEKKQKSLQQEKNKISSKPNKTVTDKKRERELTDSLDFLNLRIAQLDTLAKNNKQNAKIEKDMRKTTEKERDKYKKESDSLRIEDNAKAKEIQRMGMNVKAKCIEKISNHKIRFAIKLFRPDGLPFNEQVEIQVAIAQMKEENKKNKIIHKSGEEYFSLSFYADDKWHAFDFESESSVFNSFSSYFIFVKYKNKIVNDEGEHIKRINDCKNDITETVVYHDSKINSVDVKVKETYEVSENKISIKVKDHGSPDGDIISLYLNDVCILSNFTLKTSETSFSADLTKNDNLLILVAESVGSPGTPCTVKITIDNNKPIVLNSTKKQSEAIKILKK